VSDEARSFGPDELAAATIVDLVLVAVERMGVA
jgi:hypothetical protein